MHKRIRHLTFAVFITLLSVGLFSTICAAQTDPQPPSQSATLPAAAQQDAASPAFQSSTVLRVTTRLVVVDVVAADKKGAPITDLKAEDFTVQEDGRDQHVRVFAFHHPNEEPAAPETAQAAAPLPANYVTNVPKRAKGGALNILLLDILNTRSTNQTLLREQMLKFLEKMPAGQPIAVYALSSKLILLQDFTTDPTLLKAALKKTKDHAAPLQENLPGGKAASYTNPVAAAMVDLGMGGMLQRIRVFEESSTSSQTDMRLALTVAAMKALARTLAGYPGRKNLIWLSESFPASVFSELVNSDIAQITSSGDRNYNAEIERMANMLSEAQVAVYPVDARTLVNSDPSSQLRKEDSSGQDLGREARRENTHGDLHRGVDVTSDLSAQSTESLSAHTSMNTIADQTGGRAFYNTNNLEGAIRQSVEDGSTYYTLGYYPDNKDWNGKFRRISVKVNRPGIKLHHRLGYFSLEPQSYAKLDPKQQSADFAQALSLDSPVATGLSFRASVDPPSEKSSNKVVINYMIDPHTLSFELKEDGLQYGSVDCAVQVFSAKGEPVVIRGNNTAAKLKAEDFKQIMGRFFPCRQMLDLQPGDYLLRLGVRDGRTGLIGTANALVTVAPPAVATGGVAGEEKKP
ncbi:MAG: VWA domain-containing protein [Acidobacteriia bacterium]|nr:VWA domain-containing protein [Terriglobia bacterium]